MAQNLDKEDKDGNSEKRVLLQFVSYSSMIDASFWHELSKLKLEKLGLNDAPIDISATFQPGLNSNLPSIASINYESFLPYDEINKRRLQNTDSDDHFMFGQLMVFNTLDDFNRREKRQLIIDAGQWIWERLTDSSQQSVVDANLELHLSRFLMIVFADLKRYSYHYWCAFPAFNYPTKCYQLGNHSETVHEHFTHDQIVSLLTQYSSLPTTDRLFFAVIITTQENSTEKTLQVMGYSQFWSTVNSLSGTNFKVYFSYLDPSPNTKYPGWPVRNYIAYLYLRLAQLLKNAPTTEVQELSKVVKSMFTPYLPLLSIRLRLSSIRRLNQPDQSQQTVEHFYQLSAIHRIVFGSSLQISSVAQSDTGNTASTSTTSSDSVDNVFAFSSVFNETPVMPPIVGWERNPSRNNQLQPRFVDCSHQLDPKVLSSDAVHLNLKLMKWRIVPQIDLETVRTARCLLLGAGTLGCNIARSLMAWGVSRITLVDGGTLSYSNPVRQTLYTFADCLPQSGNNHQLKGKAVTAAEALRLISPGVEATGVQMSIPMPGHAVMPATIRAVEADVRRLEAMIADHDVVFLLMDTRESRWLPTVIAASQHKIVINVALGFDTFLVQRHGIRFRPENAVDQASKLFGELQGKLEVLQAVTGNEKSPILMGNQLGCYYCNDVFAPGDTTRDRTLDQQCTVTRPGLSMIASGYAVELLASLLQHSAKALAPAFTYVTSSTEDLSASIKENELTQTESILGLIPHQIRGFLSRAEQISPSYRAFDCCTACSFTVIDKYRQEGFKFLLQVFNDSTVLEEITGLKKFHTFDEEDICAFDSDENVQE